VGNTEEREINLKHLFFTLCKKWMQIVICALIGAIVFGGYGCYKGKAVIKEIDEKEFTQKKENLVKLKNYLKNSVLVRNSNIELRQRTLQIDIVVKDENSSHIMKVFESYANAIQSEEFYNLIADRLGEETDEYIYELINVPEISEDVIKNNIKSIYSLRNDLYGNTVLSFMAGLLGKDDNYTSTIASLLKQYMESQKISIDSFICPHSFYVYNIGSKNIAADTSKQTKLVDSIKGLEKEIASIKGNNNTSYKKWILIGFIVGAFMVAGLYTLLYVFSDKLHEADEIQDTYGLYNLETLDNMRLIASKKGYNSICVLGTAKESSGVTSVNLDKADAVLLAETVEVSKHKDIEREILTCRQYGIPIVGYMVFYDGEVR